MNLQQTIADLEKLAAKYTEAANALRALQAGGSAASPAAAVLQSAKAPDAAKKGGRKKAGKQGGKRVVSAETRAKLAEAMRRRHAQKRAGAK